MLCCCRQTSEPPTDLALEVIEIAVWDAKEPRLVGAQPYSQSLFRIVESFIETYEIPVEVEFKTRQEIENLLLDNYEGHIPPVLVVFSTEWPFVGVGTQNLTETVKSDDYLKPTIAYWTHEDKLMGIPSYIHWHCLAKKGLKENDLEAIGCLTGSPRFLYSAIGDWNSHECAENVFEYVKWAKDISSINKESALDLWTQNYINMMYPVTPQLFKWLKLSELNNRVNMFPIDNPQGNPDFYFSVPAYLVVTQNNEIIKPAIELAKLLARAKGKWAAKVLGCIPACAKDVSIFNLESGLEQNERVVLINSFYTTDTQVINYTEYEKRNKIRLAITQTVEDYLSGTIGKIEFEQGIRSALKGYTNK